MIPPSLQQFGLPFSCNPNNFPNLGVGERAANRTQGQGFDLQFHCATMADHVNVGRRMIMHIDHEPKPRLVEDGRHLDSQGWV